MIGMAVGKALFVQFMTAVHGLRWPQVRWRVIACAADEKVTPKWLKGDTFDAFLRYLGAAVTQPAAVSHTLEFLTRHHSFLLGAIGIFQGFDLGGSKRFDWVKLSNTLCLANRLGPRISWSRPGWHHKGAGICRHTLDQLHRSSKLPIFNFRRLLEELLGMKSSFWCEEWWWCRQEQVVTLLSTGVFQTSTCGGDLLPSRQIWTAPAGHFVANDLAPRVATDGVGDIFTHSLWRHYEWNHYAIIFSVPYGSCRTGRKGVHLLGLVGCDSPLFKIDGYWMCPT